MKLNKKTIIVSVTVLIVALIALVMMVFRKNEETPLKNIEDILNDKPTNAKSIAEDVAPKFLTDPMFEIVFIIARSDGYKDSLEEAYENSENRLEDTWEELYSSLEEKYGANVEFYYDIEKKIECEDKELELAESVYQDISTIETEVVKIIELLSSKTKLTDKEVDKIVKVIGKLCDEFEDMSITKGYKMDVDVYVEGEEDDKKEEYKVVVVKGNGEWYIDPVLTYAYNEEMSLDEFEEWCDDEIEDKIEESKEDINDHMDLIEKIIKNIDEDVIELLLNKLSKEGKEN